jgi:hypothetical protein
MFTACFDAGGSQHDQRFVVVAGFISSANTWIKFDYLWRERLAKDGLTYFHMEEFAHSRGVFKDGWKNNEPRRKALLSDLMNIIRMHAFRKFGCVIEHKQFTDVISREERERYYLDAFSFAGLYCAHQVNQWRLNNQISTAPELVFENGDLGKGHLMDRLKNDSFGTPIFRLKKDTETLQGKRLAFTPLQAADFLAYEIFLANKRWEEPGYKARWGMEEFHRMMGDLVRLDEEELGNLNEDLSFTERLEKWFDKLKAELKGAPKC